MKHFIKEYGVDLAAGIAVLVGIFLVADFTIRDKFVSGLSKLAQAVLGILNQILTGVGDQVSALSASDMLGVVLILLSASFIVWRIRYRFQTGKRWSIDYCPKCTSPIMRVHRTLWDQILGVTFLPEARRYRCADAKCGWTGLLRRHVHRRRSRSEAEPEPGKN